MDQI
ncbi:hypothetical protein F383_27126 [Gossypium arboreum]|jgi:hypothetical protein